MKVLPGRYQDVAALLVCALAGATAFSAPLPHTTFYGGLAPSPLLRADGWPPLSLTATTVTVYNGTASLDIRGDEMAATPADPAIGTLVDHTPDPGAVFTFFVDNQKVPFIRKESGFTPAIVLGRPPNIPSSPSGAQLLQGEERPLILPFRIVRNTVLTGSVDAHSGVGDDVDLLGAGAGVGLQQVGFSNARLSLRPALWHVDGGWLQVRPRHLAGADRRNGGYATALQEFGRYRTLRRTADRDDRSFGKVAAVLGYTGMPSVQKEARIGILLSHHQTERFIIDAEADLSEVKPAERDWRTGLSGRLTARIALDPDGRWWWSASYIPQSVAAPQDAWVTSIHVALSRDALSSLRASYSTGNFVLLTLHTAVGFHGREAAKTIR